MPLPLVYETRQYETVNVPVRDIWHEQGLPFICLVKLKILCPSFSFPIDFGMCGWTHVRQIMRRVLRAAQWCILLNYCSIWYSKVVFTLYWINFEPDVKVLLCSVFHQVSHDVDLNGWTKYVQNAPLWDGSSLFESSLYWVLQGASIQVNCLFYR